MIEKAFDFNEHYMLKDGKPWFPVMGEMHYSRYREDLWEESLRKMKAGGLSIVSTYLIWIHHEEEEGVFDFSGCRDLGKFVRLCQKVGISVFLRLGPWVHGEVRNGGFPDWLQHKDGLELRSDDEQYLAYVRRYWEKAFEQVKGMMYQDGGPVIGIQIENEYGHVGGFTGEKGENHMKTLAAMAREIGFEAPLYTATGWGGAVTGGLLPVMGGYCEAPWDQRTTELEANTNYVFSQTRNDALIACDHHVEGAVTFDESKFPYLTAELGGGLQVTEHRRPVATGKDIGAMSLAKLGSGVALLGYYMYHGGSNPKGKLSALQESRATGYQNNLPEINYDFNAPIRQYGTISDNYKEIKALAYFLQEFGADFTMLREEISPENVKPEDLHTLRLSCRHDKEHGYVFFNNYQRRRQMEEHKGVRLVGKCEGKEVVFPEITIASGMYGFFPYNMQLGDAVLESATATPLCSLQDGGERTYVFYGDLEPAFQWAGETQAKILHLSKREALDAWKVSLDKEYLIISDNYVWEEEGRLKVFGEGDTLIKCYPKAETLPGFICCGQEGDFWLYGRKSGRQPATAEVALVEQNDRQKVYEITVKYPEAETETGGEKQRVQKCDTLLFLNYAGMKMDIFIGEEKINDHFYTGQEVPVSMRYFDFPEKLKVVIDVLHEGEKVFLETWPEMQDGKACELYGVRVQEEYC